MEQSDLVINFTILLGAALVGGMIAHRLRQPVILGYLIIGMAVGPHALNLVNDLVLVQGAATLGVALLMLTLGLEVSFSQLKQVGKIGLWGGIAQILITFALGMLVSSVVFKWSLTSAVLFGLVISLSSTVVCLKILMERGELDSTHGRIMIAFIILQDISVVLMIVITPMLGGAGQNIGPELREITIIEQNIMQRCVGKHDAQKPVVGGHVADDGRVVAPADEDDRTLLAEEQGFFFI